MSTAPNGLTGWLGTSGINPNMFSAPPGSPPPQQGPPAPTGTMQGGQNSWGNPAGYGNPSGAYENQRNLNTAATENTQLRNQLIPQFANQLFGLAQGPSQFYNQLMNLGSPYYQQQQYASFNQGNQQSQNAAAQARQQLEAQGQGYTPSGTEAAMLGGMGQQTAGNLNMQFLQNLFNNEQMQMQGAQGLGQLASLFQPQGLFGGSTTQASIPQNFFQNLSSTLGSVFGNQVAGGTASSLAGLGG